MNPIIYKAEVQTRFSDLDPYGHVNNKHYVDFVVESRLKFLATRFNIDLIQMAKTGFGFYATRHEVNFVRPIKGTRLLTVESFVESIKNEVTLVIPFKVMDMETGKTYSDGKMDFAVIDMATGGTTPLNEEMTKLFFD